MFTTDGSADDEDDKADPLFTLDMIAHLQKIFEFLMRKHPEHFPSMLKQLKPEEQNAIQTILGRFE